MTGVRVSARDDSMERTVTADRYVCAMPVEHARGRRGRALRAADPQLVHCDARQTDWTIGLGEHEGRGRKTTLKDEHRLGWFMDPAVTGPRRPEPAEPGTVLIHPAGTR